MGFSGALKEVKHFHPFSRPVNRMVECVPCDLFFCLYRLVD